MYTHNISKKIATRRRRELLSDSLGGRKKIQLFKEYVTYHKKGRLGVRFINVPEKLQILCSSSFFVEFNSPRLCSRRSPGSWIKMSYLKNL